VSNNSQSTINNIPSDNFEFPLGISDTILVLTINKSKFKEEVRNIISKMIVIEQSKNIDINNLSLLLGRIGIDKLNIYSIHGKMDVEYTDVVRTNKGCEILYINVNLERFISYLNIKENFFEDYNKHSLYIIRHGNYIDIKNIFSLIDNVKVNLGRGGSQKSHMLSPLDFRLSAYLMAMFNFNFKLINSLNTFNYISKDRYLSWMDKLSFKKSSNKIKFYPITGKKLPGESTQEED